MRLLALLLGLAGHGGAAAHRASAVRAGAAPSLNAGAEAGVWTFVPALPDVLLTHDAMHGVQFVDVTRRPVV